MAILTVSEQADMLKRLATNVMDHGTAQLYPSYARAILDVLAAFEELQRHNNTLVELVLEHEATIGKLSTERDTLASQRQVLAAKAAAIPWKEIVKVFRAADNDGCYSDAVYEWLMENGVQP